VGIGDFLTYLSGELWDEPLFFEPALMASGLFAPSATETPGKASAEKEFLAFETTDDIEDTSSSTF